MWATRGGREAANLPLNWNSQTRKPQPLQKVQTLLGTAVEIFFFLSNVSNGFFFFLKFSLSHCPSKISHVKALRHVLADKNSPRRVARFSFRGWRMARDGGLDVF